jgi:hypothetical protein
MSDSLEDEYPLGKVLSKISRIENERAEKQKVNENNTVSAPVYVSLPDEPNLYDKTPGSVSPPEGQNLYELYSKTK